MFAAHSARVILVLDLCPSSVEEKSHIYLSFLTVLLGLVSSIETTTPCPASVPADPHLDRNDFTPLLLQGVRASESEFMHCWPPEAVSGWLQVFFRGSSFAELAFLSLQMISASAWSFFLSLHKLYAPSHHQAQRAEGSVDLD